MNSKEILHYGNREVVTAIEGLSGDALTEPGVTTLWSVKDVLAHLTSYEWLLCDALEFVLENGKTGVYLALMSKEGDAAFNEKEVGKRQEMSFEEVLAEYQRAYEKSIELLERLPAEKLRETGTIPWYGKDYSLEDFIVYATYGHKREHSGQIKQFRKRGGY